MKPVEFHPDAAEEARETAAHYEGIRAGLGADFRAQLDAAREAEDFTLTAILTGIMPEVRAQLARKQSA
jgi:hypothetical protein